MIDPLTNRLYISHLGDGTVHVLDLAGPSVLATIDGVASVHGIALAPDQHRVLASASGTDEAVIIDAGTLTVTGRVPTGNTPDGIAYDPVHGRAYVSNEHDHAETVIDVGTGSAAGSIDIGGEAGNTVFDPVSGNIMINVQTTNQLITVNPATNQITGRIGVTGCESNHGLYIDGADRLAFVACEGNAKLLVVDLESKETTARIDVGQSPDVLAYDAGLHRLYVAAESGVVSVFEVQGKALHELAKARLADGAHTVAVDQETHRVYFPLENVNGKPVLRVMEPVR
ncbi:YncE family protein [Pseudarthrobacter albicanus]|uniref:YncE family protein n=1 Tax=Pseudarthrobacter albicanus TaxID=2823873 RepID=UPI0027DB8583|nr:YncE family protein [Pseudarthrobacter albicanus]